jgi:flagellar protein FlbD
MVKVTRLDGIEYYLNPHQIEAIEVNPDTTVIMLSGKHHIIRERAQDLIRSIESYRRRLGQAGNEE